MDIIDKIIAFENGDLTNKEIIDFFKELYVTKQLFGLQGNYQRCFKSLVDEGFINLKELNAEQKIKTTEDKI
jgi:hypothetical protein